MSVAEVEAAPVLARIGPAERPITPIEQQAQALRDRVAASYKAAAELVVAVGLTADEEGTVEGVMAATKTATRELDAMIEARRAARAGE